MVIKESHQAPIERPKKVVFVCHAGMEGSLCGRRMFERLLKDRKMGGFDAFHAGVGEWDFMRQVADADFLVPMYEDIGDKIRKIFNKNHVPAPPIIEGIFATIEDQGNGEKYEKLLQKLTRPELPEIK